MRTNSHPTSPAETLWTILGPLLATVLVLRLYLHIVGVRHIYPFGFLLRHLFTGTFLVIPASFVLAFRPTSRRATLLCLGILGIGSGLILDEIVYLVATHTTDADYVSWVSLGGSIGFVSLGVALLITLYGLFRKRT